MYVDLARPQKKRFLPNSKKAIKKNVYILIWTIFISKNKTRKKVILSDDIMVNYEVIK